MSLQQRIESAMRDAMRARDARRTQTLRMAMAAAQNKRIELRRDLTDADMLDVVGKQIKQRRESIEMFRSGGREEKAADEQAEAEILAEFLPEQLSDEEVEALVQRAIADSGASGPAEMGKVMGLVMARAKGRADGNEVQRKVRERLGG